ncbi:MAG TPA: hypothetical protein VIG24_18220 [Acidimicrobiia bacterium]
MRLVATPSHITGSRAIVSIADRLAKPGPQGNDPAPDGWKARLDLDSEQGGFVVTKPYAPEEAPDHSDVIREFGEDPDLWMVTKVRRSRWQTYDERWLEAAKIELAPRSRHRHDAADADSIADRISKWRPRTTASKVTNDGTFVVPAGDMQLGKGDGVGSDGIVSLFLSETERAAQRLRNACGGASIVERVALPLLGDCIEGIWSQNGALRMRLDLTPTEQVRVYRRLIMKMVQTFLPLAEKLVIPVVPGNHDEAIRVAGKMATVYDDSWAIEGASAVMDGIEGNPELCDRVEFRFPPPDDLTITMNIDGTMVGMAHGHQFGGAQDGWRKWWNGQAGGRTAIGQADVLLAAHLHHLRVQDHGDGRLFLQIPALDSGSQWFKLRNGDASPSRMVSFWTKGGAVWGLDPVTVRHDLSA